MSQENLIEREGVLPSEASVEIAPAHGAEGCVHPTPAQRQFRKHFKQRMRRRCGCLFLIVLAFMGVMTWQYFHLSHQIKELQGSLSGSEASPVSKWDLETLRSEIVGDLKNMHEEHRREHRGEHHREHRGDGEHGGEHGGEWRHRWGRPDSDTQPAQPEQPEQPEQPVHPHPHPPTPIIIHPTPATPIPTMPPAPPAPPATTFPDASGGGVRVPLPLPVVKPPQSEAVWQRLNAVASVAQTYTYQQAVDLCAAQSQKLCSRSQYCPTSHEGGDPVRGGNMGGDQWAPVADSFNDWVQVGGDSWPTCVLHSETNGGSNGKPSWGVLSAPIPQRGFVQCCA